MESISKAVEPPNPQIVQMDPVLPSNPIPPRGRKISVGICCMDVKGTSKPMHAILSRLEGFGEFKIVVFGEKVILKEPIEKWPQVDCFIGFSSKGFPLAKVVEFCDLYPTMFCLNNLKTQHVLHDRRLVYSILDRNNIITPEHLFMNRDGGPSGTEPVAEMKEFVDHIEIDGKIMEKPFVEKPISGEDHNICIYYHSKDGGGSTRLFRKVGNKSSEFHPNVSNVRMNGSFIYERFYEADNQCDLKIYTVGPNWAHAETRKSPVIDGKVERDAHGKEIRNYCTLSPEERKVVKKIVHIFGQRLCGFDMIRAGGKSYVCDVNGWSFVKGSAIYYDNCGKILREVFHAANRAQGLTPLLPIPNKRVRKGVVGVFRHADRTPKQKLKMKVSNADILQFFGNQPHKEVKLKNDNAQKELEKILKIALDLLDKPDDLSSRGINPGDSHKLALLTRVLKKGYAGTKVQLKPLKHFTPRGDDEVETVEQALFVCKWGGFLTHTGIAQAETLAKQFKRFVTTDPELLKNIQVYSNNERRVKKTAQQFAKSLLEKGKLPMSFIQDNKETERLLGHIADGKLKMDEMKHKLSEIMHLNDITQYDYPGIKAVGNPKKMMSDAYEHIVKLCQFLETDETGPLCRGESPMLMQQRWQRLKDNLYSEKRENFDTTKIPDIFDYIAYDAIHNQKAIKFDMHPLFGVAEGMADFVVSAEYGLTPEDKFIIGSLVGQSLITKIYEDLLSISQGTATSRTHLYFTSESHMQTLRNLLLHSGITKFHELVEPVELNYLSHLVFELYENLDQPEGSPSRFTISVLFSTGAHKNPFRCITKEHYQTITPRITIHNNLSLHTLLQITETARQTKAAYFTGMLKPDFNKLHEMQGINSPPKFQSVLDQVA